MSISGRAVETSRGAVGRAKDDLITPALLLDIDAAERNIQIMANRLRLLPAKLRPHIKIHKSPALAQRQVDAGAIGVATATVSEALAMAAVGIRDVLIANQVVGRDKVNAVASAAARAQLTVVVDDATNAEQLGAAARAHGSEIGVLVEIDVGMGRGGARSLGDALALARLVSGLTGLKFRGVQGYEGHCMLEPDRTRRVEKARAAMDHLASGVDLMKSDGIHCEIVSAGGTGTYDITGADPRVTEIQAGSYVLMDAFHAGLVEGFASALTVLATVVSRHQNTVVLDAGRKAVGVDFAPPQIVGYQYHPRYVAEEHALFDVDSDCPLRIGDTVELIPGYGPTTVNLYEAYHVMRDGVITDLWPIVGRGSLSLYDVT